MGLDAHVFCNCLKEGKTTKPPVSKELLYIDNDGFLEMRHTEGIAPEEENRLWNALNEWRKNCCIHQGLYYCDEHVGNWSSVRELQQSVTERSDSFPALTSIWPSCNGGQVNTETASLAFRELDEFCQNIKTQTGLFLADARTENAIYAYVRDYDGVISWDGTAGIDTGFDYGGLFVINSKTGHEYFRSMHFRQEPLPDEEAVNKDGKQFTIHPSLLTDIASGHTCKINFRIGHDENIEELKIITRPLRAEDFYSIGPLKKLLKASIETGNPIYWC